MTMENKLFFCLNNTVYSGSKKVPLSMICEVHGCADVAALSGSFVVIKDTAVIVSAFDVMKKLEALFPGYTIENLGPTECEVFLKSKKQRKPLLIAKVVFLSIVLFFGGAIAIMTFHEDVDMRGVHSSIYQFFTGVEADTVPIVSIPYSIGIAIGFTMLYGLFQRKKKKPTILDLDINKHENILRGYIADKSKPSDG